MATRKSDLYRLLVTAVLVCASGTIVRSQPVTPKPKPNGSISGYVTIDGKGAPGIPIAAIAGETINRADAAGRAVTNTEGHYRITGLEPGQYQVWTLTPAMIPDSSSSQGYIYPGSIKSVILAANEEVQDLDLKLIRGSVITGRISDADNHPIVEERITVQLLDANGAPRLGAVGSRSDEMYRTDDRGIYRIFGLPPGRYKVSVGFDPQTDSMMLGRRRYPRTYYPEGGDQAKATIIELKEGDAATNIDIKVEPPTPTYSISGHVIDATTRLPIARAGVRFALVQKGQGPPLPGIGMQTDDRGEFSLSGFAPGEYSGFASSENYGGNFYGDPISVEVTDKDVAGLELKTTPGLSLSGIVVAEGISMKELLSLLPGLRVSARGITTNNQFNSGGYSVVAPDGSFEVDGLRPGPVNVFISTQNPGLARPTINRIEHNGIGLNQGFDIQQSISGVRVVINYGTGSIRGTVRFEGDPSFTTDRIYVRARREGARDTIPVRADARGNFLIKNLSPGSYEVTAQVAVPPTSGRRPPPPQKQVVNVVNGAEAEVNLVIDLAPKPGGP
jgi:hypothetical protein